jgi:hypothetical protein
VRNPKKLLFLLIVGLGASSTMHAQQSGSDLCQLKNYQSGDQITITGTVTGTPHGLFFHLPSCWQWIVLAYPSQLQESEKAGLPDLRKYENFEKLNADLTQNPANSVRATISGRLDVAKSIPLSADACSKNDLAQM